MAQRDYTKTIPEQLELFKFEMESDPHKQGRRPVIITIAGSWIFPSIREASRELGISRTRLNDALKRTDGCVSCTNNRIFIDDALTQTERGKAPSVKNRKRKKNGSTEEKM